MVRKLRWAAMGLTFVLAAGVNLAIAQVTATVVLKSGERHTGRDVIYRLDKPEVSVRTGPGQQPRITADQVAYIEFGPTGNVDPKITGTQQAVVLRDGTVMRGEIIVMGHGQPGDETSQYVVVMRDERGQEHRLPVDRVGRVYFTSPTAATTGKADLAPARGDGITVSSRQQWTPTGVTVRAGERLTFETTGEIQLSDDPKDVAGPAGALSQRKAPNAPLPGNFVGALIARVGTGTPFPIGDQREVTMPASGQLFLGINDDHLDDNRGEFRVQVKRAGRR